MATKKSLMPKLFIKKKANLIHEFNISEEKKYTTIGSGKENDLDGFFGDSV